MIQTKRAVVIAFSLSLVTGVILSCGKKEESSQSVKISLSNSKSILIPGSTKSCRALAEGEDSDIQSLYFTFRNPKITWESTTSDFALSYMKIKLISPNFSGGEVTCVIDGEELQAMFKNTILDDLEITNATDKPLGNDPKWQALAKCPIKCGGVAVQNPDVGFVTSGELTVVGVEIKGEDEVPASGRKEIELEYIPF